MKSRNNMLTPSSGHSTDRKSCLSKRVVN